MMQTSNAAPQYRWIILGVNFLFLTFAYAGLSAWSIAIPQLSTTFDLSSTQTQLGSSALMAGYAVGSFIEALISARIGFKKTGLLASVLLLVPQFTIPYVDSYGVILLLRFIQGWGIVWFVTVSMTTAWFPLKERGLASGVVGGAIPAGIGLGGVISARLLGIADTWQQAFIYFGVMVLIVVAIWAVFAKDAPASLYADPSQPAADPSVKVQVNPFKLAAGWLVALCLFANAFQLIGFNSVLPNYMYDLNYTPADAGTVILLCGLIGVLSTPLGGVFSDRLAAGGIAPIKARAYVMALPGFLTAGIFTILFPFAAPSGYWLLALIAVCACWGVPLTNASIGALPLDMLKNPDIAGKLFGMTILIGLMGAVIAPFLITAVSASLGWTTAFVILGIAALAGTVLGLIIPKFQN
ncbi:MAG: MFS transporter [Desulfovibrio sp.]|jgi:MFS family permease|nr:MFS transporter [Desulfovibrio sp.]